MIRHPIMNDRIVSKKQLRAFYSFLAAIASIAAIKSLFWPRWPEARPLDQQAITEALNAAGLHATPLNPLAAKRNAELATSAVIGYSIDDGLELRLMRGRVRKRFNFQTAFLSTLHPELRLKQRQLTAGPPPAAIGLVASQPAFQTCLVQESQASEAFGATRDELSALVDRANQSRWRRLRSIVGLQSNRTYECILIQATNTKDLTASTDRSTWLRILGLLRPALQSEANKSSL